MKYRILITLVGWLLAAILMVIAANAQAKQGTSTGVLAIQKTAEQQIRNMVEPVLERYCRDECKLMSVQAEVDLATQDTVAPGFDEIDPKSSVELAASKGRVKLLIDEKIGPVSRTKIIELLQQYLETLDYPVKIETQVTRFPQPVGSATKIAELRERISKQFKTTLDELFKQFCPDRCMVADYQLQTEVVNAEEAQYGSGGEFVEDAGVALRVKDLSASLLLDDSLTSIEQQNIVDLARLKTNTFKNVSLSAKAIHFPKSLKDDIGIDGRSRSIAGTVGSKEMLNSTSTTQNSQDQRSTAEYKNELKSNANVTESKNQTNHLNETNARQERFERFEKIERVENGDAVQAELQKFKVYGLVFACSVLSMLIFLALSSHRARSSRSESPSIHRVIQSIASDPTSTSAPSTYSHSGETLGPVTADERSESIHKRFEIERLTDELMSIFAQQPKVAKHVFSRVLTEEGVEVTAGYVHIFGESVVLDMLRDPSLQSDMAELMEFYAKNTIDIDDEEKLDLLKKLHHRTVSGKLAVMGSRSSHLFDFLADMDGTQILELIRNESITVKAIIVTQCDSQKRATIYAQMDQDLKMKLMSELSRIDYLPRDYIFNVANALKRKRRDNPRLNTEALPGSEVLVTLLERSNVDMQRTVVKNLELANPDSARTIKHKLVSIDTLRYLRDGQLLEVVLSLKHEELLHFLKGAPEQIRQTIFSKSPKDLVVELEEELVGIALLSREAYQAVERKVLNRMKVMANEGLINLVETNDRLLSEAFQKDQVLEAGPAQPSSPHAVSQVTPIKKVAGW